MPDSLYEYAQRLKNALSNDTQFAAYNKDMRHASVVVCLAFEYAKETVWLLSNKLDRELYGSKWFLQSARKFVGQENSTLEILVESDLESGHPVAQLAAEHRDKVTIKRVPDELLDDYGYNCMVIDRKGYRFEKDRAEPQAVVFFNDESESQKEFVATLLSNFEILSSVAVPLNLSSEA